MMFNLDQISYDDGYYCYDDYYRGFCYDDYFYYDGYDFYCYQCFFSFCLQYYWYVVLKFCVIDVIYWYGY